MPRKSTRLYVRAMSEEEFQNWLVLHARYRRWRVFFFPGWAFRLAMASLKRSRRSDRLWPDKGWPDLVMLRNGKLIVAELKVGYGKPSDEQNEWIAALQSYGIPCYVWYPKDRDFIEALLE